MMLRVITHLHCVKIVYIWSFSGPHFSAFELNTERYSKSLRIQSKCGEIRTRKTPYKDTFYAVLVSYQSVLSKHKSNEKSTRFICDVINSMRCILCMASFKVDKAFGKFNCLNKMILSFFNFIKIKTKKRNDKKFHSLTYYMQGPHIFHSPSFSIS